MEPQWGMNHISTRQKLNNKNENVGHHYINSRLPQEEDVNSKQTRNNQ